MSCKQILKHAITYGLNENRCFTYEDSNVFPENIINSNIELLKKYGYNEGRKICKTIENDDIRYGFIMFRHN